MNAPIKSALLSFTFLTASTSVAWADYTAGPGWNSGTSIQSSFKAIAPDYSMSTTQDETQFDQTTKTPEAATVFLCGAGTLVIFAGIGIRRGADKKSVK